MEWVYLMLAIATEVAGTTLFKFANGFQNLIAFGGGMLLFVISLAIWTLSLTRIDVSVAYAIWSGVGTTLIVLIGFIFFGEQVTPFKLLFISLIIVGAIGLNLTSSAH